MMHRGPSLVLCLVAAAAAANARASVALLMEEPYGEFGAMNPTGHAAVYFNHICADSPTSLRPCHDGEFGVVISRYHKIDGYDWLAIPLVAYLYAVDSPNDVPQTVDKEQVAALRDAYRKQHLLDLAPDNRHGGSPKGEWTELVGSSYDRTIHGFQVDSTPAQDQRFITTYNDRRNVGHFNLLFHNCADFSRVVLDIYLPHAIHLRRCRAAFAAATRSTVWPNRWSRARSISFPWSFWRPRLRAGSPWLIWSRAA
jgi:hypothetical protein